MVRPSGETPVFAAIPLLALPVLLYNLDLLLQPGGMRAAGLVAQLASPVLAVRMASGAAWPVTVGDLYLAAALVVLFIELLKSRPSRKAAIVNHALSLVLFMACLVEFLLLKGFATSVFVLIALMVLLDVLAGFIVTIASTRRDVDLHG